MTVDSHALVSQDGRRSLCLGLWLSCRAVGWGCVDGLSLLLSSCAFCSCGVWRQVATKPGVASIEAGRSEPWWCDDDRRLSGWGVVGHGR
jgi:hypothetical protein